MVSFIEQFNLGSNVYNNDTRNYTYKNVQVCSMPEYKLKVKDAHVE